MPIATIWSQDDTTSDKMESVVWKAHKDLHFLHK